MTIYLLSPLDIIPWTQPAPAFSPLRQKFSGPCIRPPFNIKAPLRAKDFEKIGVARTSYHSPALAEQVVNSQPPDCPLSSTGSPWV